jgi:type IV pilus assembly protein PilV
LIEVLVAVAILAFGLLGIAALQATALRNSQSSYQRSQAVSLTYSILDRMRANTSVVHSGGYDTTNMCEADDVPDDGGAQAASDLGDWLADVQKTMGSTACGRIECTGKTLTHQCKVTVTWDDSRGTHTADDGTEGGTKQTLSTITAI